jgi:hypothetical protein
VCSPVWWLRFPNICGFVTCIYYRLLKCEVCRVVDMYWMYMCKRYLWNWTLLIDSMRNQYQESELLKQG